MKYGVQGSRVSRGRGGAGLISKPVIHLLLIAVLGLIVYSNTFHSPFQWDEAVYIVDNLSVRDLSSFMDPSSVPGMNPYSFKNRYIGYLTFALNYRLHGFDVTGYHVVNLAIHITNAVLVYFMVLLTLRTPYFEGQGARGKGQSAKSIAQSATYEESYVPCPMPHTQFLALAVALLFVSHPVQTEAVTYVFQRLTSLVSMFYLLSLVLYIKARLESHRAEGIVQGAKGSRRSLLYALCSLLAAVLAMKTKENAFTLPVVITLYEFLFFTGALRRRLLRLAPFLLTMLIIPVSIMQIEGSLGETMKPMTEPAALGYENLSGTEYFFTQFRVIVTYLRLLLCPVNQNVVYDYPIYNSLFELPVLLSFLVLSALFGTAVYLVYKTRSAKSIEHRAKSIEHGEGPSALRSMPWAIGPLRLVAFGILWFFITLSVESSVIPLAMVIDEYRVYLPSAGFFLASAGCASLLWRPRGMSLKIPFTAFLVIILTLSYATYARNSLWTDKVRLWEDVARKNPDSPKVYNNLGIAYYEKGRYDKAIDMYERAVSLSPGNYFAYSNLATAYAVTGRLDRAIDNFRKAIALDPGNGVVYSNLGHALRKLGRFAEAAEVYLKAVTLNPYDGAAFYGLGAACASLGRLDDALNAYSRFAELSPRDPEAYRGRGNVYAKKGDMSRAEADFRKACSLGSVEGCAKLRNIR